GSIVTAMCYGEFYPNPAGIPGPPAPWSDSAWREYQKRVPFLGAFVAEVLGTAVLALVVFAVSDTRSASAPPGYLAPIIVGLVVAALISIIAPLTQCCLNPAGDFGPRLFTFFAAWGTAVLPGPTGHGVVTVYIVAPLTAPIPRGGV